MSGDILVMENCSSGPEGELVPFDYYDPELAVMKKAIAKGVYCVAAACNSGLNLDDPKYN